MSGTKHALVMANSRYDHSGLRQLTAPIKDAEALAEVLGDAEIGGFQVKTVIDQCCADVMHEIEMFFSGRARDDLLLLYFSGHGLKDEDGKLYLAARNTDPQWLRSTAIPDHFVNQVMSSSRSKRQVMLLDCCYSGAFAKSILAKGDDKVVLKDHFEGRGRVLLTASDAIQFSFEAGNMQSTSSSPGSVFTQALVDGLKTGEADRDGDGLISLDELYDFVHDRVQDLTPSQRPMKWAFDVEGDIMLARNPAPFVQPAELPAEIREALNSNFAGYREEAVHHLERLLRGKNRGLSVAARGALEVLTRDDSRKVSDAATKCLAGAPPPNEPSALSPTRLSPPPIIQPTALSLQPQAAPSEAARLGQIVSTPRVVRPAPVQARDRPKPPAPAKTSAPPEPPEGLTEYLQRADAPRRRNELPKFLRVGAIGLPIAILCILVAFILKSNRSTEVAQGPPPGHEGPQGTPVNPPVFPATNVPEQTTEPSPAVIPSSPKAYPVNTKDRTEEADPNLPARRLLAKVIEGMGGSNRVFSVRSFRTQSHGQVATLMGNLQGSMETLVVFPDKIRIRFTGVLAGATIMNVHITRVMNGDSGWEEISPIAGRFGQGNTYPPNLFNQQFTTPQRHALSPKDLQDLRLMLRMNPIWIAQNFGRPGYALSACDPNTVDGIETEVLDVTAGGPVVRWFIDPDTGHVLRTFKKTTGPGGFTQEMTEARYSDWRSFDGLVIPTREVDAASSTTAGTMTTTEILETFEINPEFDPTVL